VSDQRTRAPFPAEAGVAFAFGRACIEAGAAVYPGQGGADGLLGDHALVTPPLTINSAEIDELIGAIDHGLTTVENSL
jgi:adenosylmethionine-8-amino-7-oxononanoate aminotransferase